MLPLKLQQRAFWFQPIIDLTEGRVAGYEALARFHSPAIKDTQTAMLMVEDMGLSVHFDKESLLKIGCMLSNYHGYYNKRIMVNISSDTASSEHFYLWLKSIIHHFPRKECLGIEVTETCPITDVDIANGMIELLNKHGVKVYLDDVGSGYMDTHAVKCFKRFSGLKVSGALIDLWRADPFKVEEVREIITLAESANATVTAEHLDDGHEIQRALSLGIHYAQSFAIGRPLPSPEAPNIIERRFNDLTTCV